MTSAACLSMHVCQCRGIDGNKSDAAPAYSIRTLPIACRYLRFLVSSLWWCEAEPSRAYRSPRMQRCTPKYYGAATWLLARQWRLCTGGAGKGCPRWLSAVETLWPCPSSFNPTWRICRDGYSDHRRTFSKDLPLPPEFASPHLLQPAQRATERAPTTDFRTRQPNPGGITTTPRCRKPSTSRTRATRPSPLATFPRPSSCTPKPFVSTTRNPHSLPTAPRYGPDFAQPPLVSA